MTSKLAVSCEHPCQKQCLQICFWEHKWFSYECFISPQFHLFVQFLPGKLLTTRDEIPVFDQFLPGKFPFPGDKFSKCMLSSAQLPGHFVFPWGEKVRTNEFPESKIPVFSAPIDQIFDWVMTLKEYRTDGASVFIFA